MSVNLSFIGGAGWQFFDDSGNPLSGGKIYTYAAGTTTPQDTYTSRTGLIPNTNPIILDAAGRTPEEVWSTEGLLYKYVVADANDVVIRTWDNIGGSVVASDLAVNLASTANNSLGDALIGFKQSDANGFVTGAVAKTVNDKLQEVVSVKDFGAIGDGVTNDTDAFAAASAYINSIGGGTLIIPPGTYIVGKQTFNGVYYRTGQTVRYAPSKILWFSSCTRPVSVIGNGAVLKVADGLKFGSFDSNGNPTGGINTNPANAGFGAGDIIYFNYCNEVSVDNLEIDGNMANLVLGGQWGDTGYQLSSSGITLFQCKQSNISNIYTHHNALDGLYVYDLQPATENTQTYIQNCKSEYNARQGISILGCCQLTVVNSEFNFTGQGTFGSNPKSGCDIEPDGPATNIKFINCKFLDNFSTGIVCDNQDPKIKFVNFDSCEFVGCNNYSIWVRSKGFTFTNCRIRGEMVSYTITSQPNDKFAQAPKFINCLFDNEDYNGKTVFGVLAYSNDGSTHEGVTFLSCRFVLYKNIGTLSLGAYDGMVLDNCDFYILATDIPAGTLILRIRTRQNNYGVVSRVNNVNVYDDSGVNVSANPWLVYLWMPETSVTNGTSILLHNGTNANLMVTSNGTYNAGFSTTNAGAVLPTALTLLKFKKLYDLGVASASEVTILYSNAAPVAGTYNQGDMVLNQAPTAGGYIGWVCVSGGTPGTWKTFGAISA